MPLLDTQTPTIGATLTTREVENLPSLGRDPLQLVRLTPGVFGDGSTSSSGGTTQMPGSSRPSAEAGRMPGGPLGEGHRRPPNIAVSPRSELLVLDADESRVLRYHIAF